MVSRLPGQPPVLAGFQYLQALGAGGFADVFLFEQHMPRRKVAVKVMLKGMVDEDLIRMFRDEADAMAHLSAHPSIVTIYEASISADGRPYLVMEFCPDSYTKRYRTEEIPVAQVLSLGVKIGSALETAHRSGMLHRDIKPSNILTTQYGAPVLADFGIVTGMSSTGDESYVAMSVPWSAPEVVDESTTGSVATEVWSLGATLYTLLAGHSPFERPGRGQNAQELIKGRILRAAYTPIKRADVPAKLQEVLKKSMAKQPSHRYATVAEMIYELQLIQHELGIPHTPLEIESQPWAQVAQSATTGAGAEATRGPVRSVVAVESRRAPRATGGSAPTRRGAEIPGGDDHAPGIRKRTVIWLVAGAAVVAAAVAVGAVALWGGL